MRQFADFAGSEIFYPAAKCEITATLFERYLQFYDKICGSVRVLRFTHVCADGCAGTKKLIDKRAFAL